jgi:hypothetical protein
LPFRLQTARDVIDLIEEQVTAVRDEPEAGTLEKARTIGYLAGIALRAIEAGDLAARIAELHIDPDTLLRDLPCFVTIERARTLIPGMALNEDQAAEFLGDADKEARPITSASTLAEMRAFLDVRIEWWD